MKHIKKITVAKAQRNDADMALLSLIFGFVLDIVQITGKDKSDSDRY
ncbi:MAG: hypothetical protein QG656_2489 [Candidatus Hydrogenedentes bacterium]|jgi:hypothetical protein|nr:hypothetical protein [Candidatus Hydrogenedentota bacterium]